MNKDKDTAQIQGEYGEEQRAHSTEQVAKMRKALVLLLQSYAVGERSPEIGWDELNSAFSLAKEVLPGEYEKIVKEMWDGYGFDDDPCA